MIFNATTKISEELTQAGIKNSIIDNDSYSSVELSFSTSSCVFQLRFITLSEKEIKAITVDFAKFPSQRLQSGYEIVNDLNRKYKFAKFSIDPNDGGICAQFDFPTSLPDNQIGEIAIEISLRFMKIIETIYPEIMKAIWT